MRTNKLRNEEAEKAEQYLVKVLHHSTASKTFNQLQLELYADKKTTLVELPPTSFSLSGHLLRCHYIICQSLLLIRSGFSEDIAKLGPPNEALKRILLSL